MSRGANGVSSAIAYGLLGLPLAMAALPIYVQAPSYYTSQLGAALASVGWVLFLARFVDALQDPWLGLVIDRWQGKLTTWFVAAGVVLALAFFGLWLPPVSTAYLIWWLAAMLILAYVAHSMLNIAYLSWGARMTDAADPNATSIIGAAAWREAAGLIGVILASVIPSLILAAQPEKIPARMGWYSLLFAVLLMLALIALLRAAPVWQRTQGVVQHWRSDCKVMLANRAFKAVLLPYFLNAVAVSVPATLVLFFINDRLQAASYSAGFLASYFIAAAIGLPCWVWCAKRIGVLASWRLGMGLAVVAFVSAGLMSAGAVLPFFIICIISGLALGADLALPPVLLANVIASDVSPAAYYGIWTLLAKLALAVSGLTLPLLALVGYHPGHPATAALAWVYAGVPCLFKLMALVLLLKLPPALSSLKSPSTSPSTSL